MKQDYKLQTKEQLTISLSNLKLMLMGSYKSLKEKSKVKVEHRTKIRKEVARIKTELRRRDLKDER